MKRTQASAGRGRGGRKSSIGAGGRSSAALRRSSAAHVPLIEPSALARVAPSASLAADPKKRFQACSESAAAVAEDAAAGLPPVVASCLTYALTAPGSYLAKIGAFNGAILATTAASHPVSPFIHYLQAHTCNDNERSIDGW